MIKQIKKYTSYYGIVFYAVVYLLPNINKNKCYFKTSTTVDNLQLEELMFSYPISRLDSMDLDYLTDPLVNGVTDQASRQEILEYLKEMHA